MRGLAAVLSWISVCLCSHLSAQVPERIPNIDYGSAGDFLAGHTTNPEMNDMGRLSIISHLGPYAVTIPQITDPPAHLQNELWDFSDPTQPRSLGFFDSSYMPGGAHATMRGYDPLADNMMLYLGAGGEVAGIMASDGNAELRLDGQLMNAWSHLQDTGVIGMPNFMGNLLIYASDQSRTGMATYDISDPLNPVLLDVLDEDDHVEYLTWEGPTLSRLPGGYWHEISGHRMVFSARENDAMGISHGSITVVDFSDPRDLRVTCHLT